MPRGAAAHEAFTVGKILNEAQRSVAGHKKCAAALWRLAARDMAGTLRQLCDCLRHVLQIGQREAHVERVIRFAAFAASQPPAAAEAVAAQLTEGLLEFLLGMAGAADKAVRFRSCQLMGAIFTALPPDMELTEELVDRTEAAMLQRLRDKAPAVRAEAAAVLARLAQPDEDNSFAEDEVTLSLLRLLASDSNKEVRKAVVGALAPDPAVTLPAIIERTRDVEPEVRRMTYRILSEKLGVLDMLSPAQQALLLRRGLGDRHPRVAASAQAMLGGWLQEVEDSVPDLLSLLDVAADEGAAEAAIRALIAGGALDPVAMAHEAAEERSGLRAFSATGAGAADAAAGSSTEQRQAVAVDAGVELLAPQEALLWRVVCEWLSAEGEARGAAAAAASGALAARESAAASDALEALEATLPATVEDLLAGAAAHAEAGPDYAFATRQLLHTAARCTDMVDAAGRAAAADIIAQLLAKPDLWVDMGSSPGGSDAAAVSFGGSAWAGALAELAAKVYASPAEMASAMLSAISGVLHSGSAMSAEGEEQFEEPAAGGTALKEGEWLHALGVAAVLLDGLEDISPRGGLLSDGAAADTQLAVRDLPQALLLPAMEQGAAVRRVALRCVGLYCLLGCEDAGSLQAPLALLRSGVAAEPDAAARAAAAAALCDAAMYWGVRLVDGLLPKVYACDYAADAADLPVVDLLLAALDAALDTESDDGAQPERAALAAAAATGLAKLLIVGAADAEAGLGHCDMVKVLARLLPLAFDPTTEDAPALRQALSAALEAFAGIGPAATRALATAFLPAARRGTALKKQMPSLLAFMAQLLQVKQAASYADAERGIEGLAAGIALEVTHLPRGAAAKSYAAALCKVLATLPLRTGAEQLPALAFAARQAADRVAGDKAALKDAEKLVARVAKALEAGGGSSAESLCDDALNAMIEAISIQDGGRELLDALPLPFEAGAAAAPTPARRRRAASVAAPASSSDEEEATPAGRDKQNPQRRAMPSRSARKPVYTEPPAESSSSDDEAASGGGGGSSGDESGDENESATAPDAAAAAEATAADTEAAATAAKPAVRGRRRISFAQPLPPPDSAPASQCDSSDGSGDELEAESSDGEENVAPPQAAASTRGKAAGRRTGKALKGAEARRALQSNIAV